MLASGKDINICLKHLNITPFRIVVSVQTNHRLFSFICIQFVPESRFVNLSPNFFLQNHVEAFIVYQIILECGLSFGSVNSAPKYVQFCILIFS